MTESHGDDKDTGKMRHPDRNRSTPGPASIPLRWWNTLFFRLALVVNLGVVGVLGGFAFIDHQRQRTMHVRNEIARLREEAKVLRVARAHLPDREGFQWFLDEFCRQMGATASPGHHIAVFDETGTILLRAHERGSPELEARMAAGKHAEVTRFSLDGEAYLSVGLGAGQGETIVVAQSLAPIEQMIQAQEVSALLSTGILAALIFGITTIGFLVWVRAPLRELVMGVAAIGRGDFTVRLHPSGSSELRYLADRVNEMAQSLEGVERQRRAEMKRAQDIQQGLLPGNHRTNEHFEIDDVFLPTDCVGGDLYDIVELEDGSTLLAVLDVLGHGVPAALYTALLRTVLRHHAALSDNVARIAQAMNEELSSIADPGEFATCFLARLSGATGEVEYVRAGHDPAIVVRASGETELLDGGDLPLGVEHSSSYVLRESTLGRGDRLFLFTDGLHEVFDPEDRPFGRYRLAGLLAETSGLPFNQQLGVVVQRVRSFQGNAAFRDDVTLLAARRR